MNKPHWEKLHDWWMEDIRDEMELIYKFKLLLRKHPDDLIGEIFRDLIKTCDKNLISLKKNYKKIYGGFPNVTEIRKNIEKI